MSWNAETLAFALDLNVLEPMYAASMALQMLAAEALGIRAP